MREIQIMTKMMNMYIYSWREHMQEAEDVMEYGFGLLVCRWGVTIYFISIV